MGLNQIIPESLKRVIIYNLPFTFFQTVDQLLNKNKVRTILDLACGDGNLMEFINKDKKYVVDGIDLFDKYLKRAKKTGAYRKLYKADVLKFKPKEKYDLIFCSNIIEHLTKKDGERLAKEILSWTNNLVILLTPYGFCQTHVHDDNPLQEHKSGWFPKDFTKLGYSYQVKSFSSLFIRDKGNEWERTLGYKLLEKLSFPFFELPEPYLVCYSSKKTQRKEFKKN